jgi:hypothetical protein
VLSDKDKKMTLEELRVLLANGYNYSQADATNEELTKSDRDFQAGRASAFLQVLGQLNKILSEKVGA